MQPPIRKAINRWLHVSQPHHDIVVLATRNSVSLRSHLIDPGGQRVCLVVPRGITPVSLPTRTLMEGLRVVVRDRSIRMEPTVILRTLLQLIVGSPSIPRREPPRTSFPSLLLHLPLFRPIISPKGCGVFSFPGLGGVAITGSAPALSWTVDVAAVVLGASLSSHSR